MFEIMSRKLFGQRCRKLIRSVMIGIFIYTGLSNLEQNIPVAHSVLMLINLSVSSAVIMQFLGSKDNSGYLKGFYSMPFEEKNFISGYAAAMGLYVLSTRTLPVYALVLAFTKVSVLQIILILSEYIFVCLGSMTVFAYFSDRKYISVLLAAAGIAMCFLLPLDPVSAVVYLTASLLLMFWLIHTDPYRFMRSDSGKQPKIRSSRSGRFLVARYIFRYLMSNRSYLISPLIITVFICFLVVSMKTMNFNDGVLIGIALSTMNTPLAIIVSSNRGLHEKLDSMPSKFKNFFIPYACFLFVYYLTVNAVILTATALFGVEITLKSIAAAIIFPLQGAAAAVYMEDKYHLSDWNVETDLWHHPRKYIVPGVLALEAGLMSLI